MKDFLVRGTVNEPDMRFVMAETTSLCRDGIIAQNCDPAGGAVLADALSSAALLSVLLENSEKYSLRLDYTGAAGTVLADVNASCDVRGMINNPQPGDGLDFDAMFGKGDIPVTVMKFSEGRLLNSGKVNCGMGTPADNIAMFFSVSDQIETEICTVCRFRPDPSDPVVHAAAFMLQALPGCDLEKFAVIREKLHTQEFRELLASGGLPMELQIKKVLAALEVEANYTQAGVPGFRCHCSKEAMKKALLTLGKEDLKKLFEEQEKVKMRCYYCGNEYIFDKSPLE